MRMSLPQERIHTQGDKGAYLIILAAILRSRACTFTVGSRLQSLSYTKQPPNY